jgi:hypothetical protein
MAEVRTGEVRLLHVMVVCIILVVVAVPILIFTGVIAGWAWLGLTKENMEKGIAAAKGYTAAKTPTESMEKFREAIHKRDYKNAAYYTTKNYGELLKKSHDNASELAGLIDKIHNWSTDKGLMTNKMKVMLFMLDPFPTNFKSGEAPKQEGESKAFGVYKWEQPYVLTNQVDIPAELRQVDPRMFTNILKVDAFPVTGRINLVKEGDDWKIDVVTTPQWEAEVSYFNDRAKTYITGLNGMWKDLNNQRYDTGPALEIDLTNKLRAAKN